LLVALASNNLTASATPSAQLHALTETPSPAHLIVGPAIKLPSQLFLDTPSAGYSLITPDQAQQVEKTMWRLWETELVRSDTRALSQLIAPGPLLASTIDNCAFPDGKCAPEKTPRSFSTLVLAVPRQTTYPLDFLAELRTTQWVDMSDGVDAWEPWVELQVLTKKSASSPWQLSFDTGYDGVNSTPPPLMTFDTYSVGFGTPDIEAYATRPSASPPVPASKYLPLLAALYQSYKDTGAPPASTPFVKNGYARAIGADLATDREGEVYAGNRQHYSFSADAGAGAWQFSNGGYPLVCGSVVDAATVTPVSGLIYQNGDETNYGIPLPPGEYKQVTTFAIHQTCVVVVQGGLDNFGDSPVSVEVVGKGGPGPSGAPRGDTAVDDLETAYSVLAGQLGEYSTESKCQTLRDTSCTKALALQITDLFSTFSNQITERTYPASAQGDAKALNSTVKGLAIQFSKVAANPKSVKAEAAAIEAGALQLNEQFGALIDELQSAAI
jgi:hypothetical protein